MYLNIICERKTTYVVVKTGSARHLYQRVLVYFFLNLDVGVFVSGIEVSLEKNGLWRLRGEHIIFLNERGY